MDLLLSSHLKGMPGTSKDGNDRFDCNFHPTAFKTLKILFDKYHDGKNQILVIFDQVREFGLTREMLNDYYKPSIEPVYMPNTLSCFSKVFGYNSSDIERGKTPLSLYMSPNSRFLQELLNIRNLNPFDFDEDIDVSIGVDNKRVEIDNSSSNYYLYFAIADAAKTLVRENLLAYSFTNLKGRFGSYSKAILMYGYPHKYTLPHLFDLNIIYSPNESQFDYSFYEFPSNTVLSKLISYTKTEFDIYNLLLKKEDLTTIIKLNLANFIDEFRYCTGIYPEFKNFKADVDLVFEKWSSKIKGRR